MHIQYDIQAKNLHAKLVQLRRKLAPQLILGSIGETLLNRHQDRHKAGLAPDGTRWQPLSAATLANRAARKVKGTRILFEHGDMLRVHYQVQGDTLRLGTNDEKAIWHHYGTKPYTISPKVAKALFFGGRFTKRVNHPGLPARPIFGFPPADVAAINRTIDDHLNLI